MKFGRVRRNDVAVIIDVDEGACQLTQFAPDELVGREPSSLIHPDDHDLAVRNWFDVLSTPPGFGHRGRSRHLRKDGSWVWLEFTAEELLALADDAMYRSKRDGRSVPFLVTTA